MKKIIAFTAYLSICCLSFALSQSTSEIEEEATEFQGLYNYECPCGKDRK